jgi:hypothetical protein
MKKDLLISLAAIEAAPKRSVGIADSAVQMFTKGLPLMLPKKRNGITTSCYGWWGHQPLNQKTAAIKHDNCGFKKLLIINFKLLIKLLA